MANKTITSVNAIFAISIEGVYDSPIQLQGFAADGIFDTDPLVPAEIVMGLDGHLSGGYTYHPVKQKIHLQADSPSVQVFEDWYNASVAAQDVFKAQATITLPGTGKSYVMKNGILTSAKMIPDAKKTLSAHEFEITWESALPAPA